MTPGAQTCALRGRPQLLTAMGITGVRAGVEWVKGECAHVERCVLQCRGGIAVGSCVFRAGARWKGDRGGNSVSSA